MLRPLILLLSLGAALAAQPLPPSTVYGSPSVGAYAATPALPAAVGTTYANTPVAPPPVGQQYAAMPVDLATPGTSTPPRAGVTPLIGLSPGTGIAPMDGPTPTAIGSAVTGASTVPQPALSATPGPKTRPLKHRRMNHDRRRPKPRPTPGPSPAPSAY